MKKRIFSVFLNNFKKRKDVLGYSWGDLGYILGCSDHSIRRWVDNGNPTLSSIAKLAYALGITPSDLLAYDFDPEKDSPDTDDSLVGIPNGRGYTGSLVD